MKIIECEQSSLEWLIVRSGIPTASDFDNLVTPEFKIRDGQMPDTFLNQKVAETWLGCNLPGFSTIDVEIGSILEDEAIPWYSFEFDEPVRRVGFITTDDGRVGCSPDGLISEGGIEIKCPRAETHVGYLRGGEVPKKYLAQVHGSMFVTGAPWWKFVSYRRGFPALVKTVMRDERIQAVLTTALSDFCERLEAEVVKLETMSGTPRRTKVSLAPPIDHPDESGEIVP